VAVVDSLLLAGLSFMGFSLAGGMILLARHNRSPFTPMTWAFAAFFTVFGVLYAWWTTLAFTPRDHPFRERLLSGEVLWTIRVLLAASMLWAQIQFTRYLLREIAGPYTGRRRVVGRGARRRVARFLRYPRKGSKGRSARYGGKQPGG
jgi:hypothetical protein